MSTFMKICQWEPSSVRASGWMDGRTDGRTDRTKLTVTFRNFANAPKSRPMCIVNSFLTDPVTYVLDFSRIRLYFLTF